MRPTVRCDKSNGDRFMEQFRMVCPGIRERVVEIFVGAGCSHIDHCDGDRSERFSGCQDGIFEHFKARRGHRHIRHRKQPVSIDGITLDFQPGDHASVGDDQQALATLDAGIAGCIIGEVNQFLVHNLNGGSVRKFPFRRPTS